MFLHTHHIIRLNKSSLSKEREKKTILFLYFFTPSQLLPASHQQIFFLPELKYQLKTSFYVVSESKYKS